MATASDAGTATDHVTAPPAVPASNFPEQPYPGARPDTSFVMADYQQVRPLLRDPGVDSGWCVEQACVDRWLADLGAPPLADRIPVLAYGSNANPLKLAAMAHGGMPLPAVLLQCRTQHLAAVWCAGRRCRDGLPPATIVPAPHRVESHFVKLCTPAQVRALDRVEGRGERYDLVPLPESAKVWLGRRRLPGVLAYVGLAPHRTPLVDQHGRLLPVADVSRAHAARLV